MTPFNKKNKYGKHLVEAIVPGWGFGEALNTSSPKGSIRVTGGRRNVEFTAQALGTPTTSASIKTRMHPYQFGGDVRVIECAQQDQNTGYRFGTSLGDLGPITAGTRRFSVVAIVKLIGDGEPGTSDPRVYSKDLDATEAGHDLMIGFVGGNNVTPRTRVNLSGTTRTVLIPDAPENDVVDDGWHLICTTVDPSGTSSNVAIQGLYPDGRYRFNTGSWVGTYSPRTTTDEALFANAGVNDNVLNGSILAVYFFENIVLRSADLQQLYERPWQVFKPRRLFAHTQDYFPPAIEAAAPAGDTLTITLVDAAGTALANLTGLSWAWFDESTVNSASTPTATGTGATTNGSGVFSVDITGTTLTSGQTGMLALQDSTGYIYALYRVTLT